VGQRVIEGSKRGSGVRGTSCGCPEQRQEVNKVDAELCRVILPTAKLTTSGERIDLLLDASSAFYAIAIASLYF
jgi:hypothetical protein